LNKIDFVKVVLSVEIRLLLRLLTRPHLRRSYNIDVINLTNHSYSSKEWKDRDWSNL